MSRNNDLERLYKILNDLKSRTGFRYLNNSNGRMNWPNQGVYFFFEDGELREETGELRVVRVGTHAVSQGSQTTLWKRLIQHRGTMTGSGNHRGSIFRLHTGTAIIARDNLMCDTWGIGGNATQKIKRAEQPIELLVSRQIGAMPFLWIKAEDKAGPQSIRKYIERNTIALLSNYHKTALDKPSTNWLGHYCANRLVRESGLWNVDHVADGYNPDFLEKLEQLMNQM